MKPRIEHLALATLLLVSGCGGGAEQPAAAKAPAKKTGDKPAATGTNAPVAAVAATTVSHKAVFATNALKDPFYPRAQAKIDDKTTKAAAAPGAPPAADAIQAALQAGFVGIFGTPDQRVGLVHNIPLEEGKNVEIPVTIGGQPRRVKAKVVKVSRTVVELQVEGVPQIVPLTLRGR